MSGRRHAPSWLLLATAVGAAWVASCRKPPARPAVLEAIGRKVTLPSYARLTATAATLVRSTRALRATPSDAALEDCQRAWREALVAFARTYALRAGPVTDLRFYLRAAFWPVRPGRIEALADEVPADDPRLEHAGVAVKGMFAMEYLLFEPAGTRTRLLDSDKRRSLLVLVTEDYQRLADNLQATAVRTDFPKQLAKGGQESVSLVVNSFIDAVETTRAVLDHGIGAKTAAGARSGAVLLIALAKIRSVRDHYLQPEGRGLAALVAALAPAVDRSVREALDATVEALSATAKDGEPASPANDQQIARAADACHTLERSMKSGLLGALGVSLTSWPADGD